MFASASRSKVQHLRDRLNNTKKLSMSADEYFTKMMGFAYEMGALGKSLDEDEVINHVLNGLDKGHYNSLITSVNGNPGTSLDELYDQLYAYDLRNCVEESTDSFSSIANMPSVTTARVGALLPRTVARLRVVVVMVATAVALLRVVVVTVATVAALLRAAMMMTAETAAMMMTATIGAAMTCAMMTAAMSAVMTGVTMTTVMVVVIALEAGGLTGLPLPTSTLSVKSTKSMVTLLVTAGGATRMTRRTIVTMIASVMTRVHILHRMALTPIGIQTRVQLITSPLS
jgi:hypothetical protein